MSWYFCLCVSWDESESDWVNQIRGNVINQDSIITALIFWCHVTDLCDVFDLSVAYIQTSRALMVFASLLGIPAVLLALLAMPFVQLGDESDGTKRKRALLAGILSLIMCEWHFRIISEYYMTGHPGLYGVLHVLPVFMWGSWGFSRSFGQFVIYCRIRFVCQFLPFPLWTRLSTWNRN